MNRELMIQVERVVRDLRATHARKMRMREELYSLLSDRVDDAISRGVGQQEATEQAIVSFGDPDELRSELQATVPNRERFSATLDRHLFGRSAEERLLEPVSAVESLRAGMLLGLMLLVVLLAPAVVLGWGFGSWKALLIWKFYLVLAGGFAWNTAVMTWCGSRAVRTLLTAAHRRQAFSVLAGWAILVGVNVGLSLALLYFSSGWQAFAEIGWWSALIAIPVAAGVVTVVCWLISIEARQRQPWVTLDLASG